MRPHSTIQKLHFKGLLLVPALFFTGCFTQGQDFSDRLYPYLFDLMPEVPSPFLLNDSIETILALTKNDQYGIVPVTVENGEPLLYSYKVGTLMGKDQQLQVGGGDFPALAKTGLHSEEQLDNKVLITGIPVDVINCTGRPNAYSSAGFMADDEDIISVLKGDNRLVQKMGLTHPQMAKPLFHVWNLILKETELGNWARFYEGHTEYRCDPIAIALIFGLKSLEEIDVAFEGKLFDILTGHFIHYGEHRLTRNFLLRDQSVTLCEIRGK